MVGDSGAPEGGAAGSLYGAGTVPIALARNCEKVIGGTVCEHCPRPKENNGLIMRLVKAALMIAALEGCNIKPYAPPPVTG